MSAFKNNLPPENHYADRRPIKTRSAQWVHLIAKKIAGWGITPNQISVLSVAAAIGGSILFLLESFNLISPWFFIVMALSIQLRLLANMLDGVVAVQYQGSSKVGVLYNEIPDRIADTLFLVAAGYASQTDLLGITLGWSAAILAISTAYVRALGGWLGFAQDYSGPLAKPQRMFLLTLGCLGAAFQFYYSWNFPLLLITLVLINFGTLITLVRRTLRLARQLEAI